MWPKSPNLWIYFSFHFSVLTITNHNPFLGGRWQACKMLLMEASRPLVHIPWSSQQGRWILSITYATKFTIKIALELLRVCFILQIGRSSGSCCIILSVLCCLKKGERKLFAFPSLFLLLFLCKAKAKSFKCACFACVSIVALSSCLSQSQESHKRKSLFKKGLSE